MTLRLTLNQYARISQALSSGGFASDEVFASEGISEDEWQALRAPWDRDIAAAIHQPLPALIADYELALQETRQHLERRLPPLDEEPRDWFGLLNAQAQSNDSAFLEKLGLNYLDCLYLQGFWRRQLATRSPQDHAMLLSLPPKIPEVRFEQPHYPRPKDPVRPPGDG